MTAPWLTNETIAGLGEKVQTFVAGLPPAEQAYMSEVLSRAGAVQRDEINGDTWNPDPVLAVRVSLRSRSAESL